MPGTEIGCCTAQIATTIKTLLIFLRSGGIIRSAGENSGISRVMLETNLGLRKPNKTAVSFRGNVSLVSTRVHDEGVCSKTRTRARGMDDGKSRVKRKMGG